MAYTVPAPAPRSRPAVVTVACALLGLVAVIQFISLLLGLTFFSDQRDAFEEIYKDVSNGDSLITVMTVATIFGIFVNVIVGIILVTLGFFNARGKQPARIITWVIGGLYLCCSTMILASSMAGSMIPTGENNSGVPDQEEVARILSDELPSWYNSANIVLSVIALCAMLTTVILLALPASNDFFRKPQRQWEPPAPYPGGIG